MQGVTFGFPLHRAFMSLAAGGSAANPVLVEVTRGDALPLTMTCVGVQPQPYSERSSRRRKVDQSVSQVVAKKTGFEEEETKGMIDAPHSRTSGTANSHALSSCAAAKAAMAPQESPMKIVGPFSMAFAPTR